jgi:hypothetical protein
MALLSLHFRFYVTIRLTQERAEFLISLGTFQFYFKITYVSPLVINKQVLSHELLFFACFVCMWR